MRRLIALALVALAAGAGLGLALRLGRARPTPDPPAVVERVREVARLEALDLSLYKKVSFAPEPRSQDSLWGDVVSWARYTFRTPRGKAIVFADAHVGLDLAALDGRSLRVDGRDVFLVLPPLEVRVELKPDETEIVGSNLDSAETAKLFELARAAFEREVRADPRVRARARGAAERGIRGLLLGLGFDEVHFVDRLPGAPAG